MAAEYEYLSGWVEVKITDREVSQGQAGNKVAAQVTQKMTEMTRDGWEFYQNIPLNANVMGPNGCLETLTGGKSAVVARLDLFILVFRRPAH